MTTPPFPELSDKWEVIGREVDDSHGMLVWTYAPYSGVTIQALRDAKRVSTVTGRDKKTGQRILYARAAR